MNLAEKARSPRRTGTSMDSLREGVGAPWMWSTTGGGSTSCKPRAAAAAAASLAHSPQVQVVTIARDAEPAAECALFHSTRQHPDLLLAEQRLDSANLPNAVGALERAADSGRRVPKHLLYCLLKRCSSSGSSSSSSTSSTEQEEEQVVARVQRLAERCGYRGDPFLATHLIGAYGARGRVDRAAQVFAQVAAPDRYNWAAILLAHARHGGAAQAAEAVRLYRRMREQGAVRPDARVFVGVIKACAAVGDVGVGREVHAAWAAAAAGDSSSHGCRDARFVQAALVSMYAKCGHVEAAREVFDQAAAGDRDVVMWNAMLAGYAQHGSGGAAIRLYDLMVSQATGTTTRSIAPNSVTYVCVLQACASVGALGDGRRVHAHIRLRRRALDQDDDVVVVGGSLVNMYAKCGSLDEALGVLDALPARNVVAWTALLAGYAQRGMGEAALALYGRMRREGGPEAAPDAVTFVCLLQACASLGAAGLARGRAVHAHIVEQGEQVEAEVGCSLVHMYVKCGSLADARSVLDKLLARVRKRKSEDDGASSGSNKSSGGVVAAWNAMLAGYAQHGMGAAAMALYHDVARELVPDAVTLVSAVQACASLGDEGGGGWSAEDALRHGRLLHEHARKLMLLEVSNSSSTTNLGSSLVDMYAKCGSLGDARAVFDALPSKDPATWAAMLGACAAAGVGALSEGRRLHAQLVAAAEGLFGGVVAASLVNMYARCGRVQDARAVFDGVPPAERTVGAWNAMVAGYVRAGEPAAALALFRAMVAGSEVAPPPTPVTYVCALAACAGVGVAAAEDGERIHARIRREGLELSQGEGGDLATSLVNMYAKCGRLDVARAVWDAVPPEERTTPMCNAMLAGYAQHGMGQQALALYRELGTAGGGGGFVPDAVTCVCLLQACAAAGALPLARTLHARLLAPDTGTGGGASSQQHHHPAVATALVSAYAKLGSMPDAHRAAVAAAPPGHAAEAWGALAAGYARHGDLPAAAAAVRRMEASSSSSSLAHPDAAAALALLTARAHSRAEDENQQQPPHVTDDLDFLPARHAACAVDMAGRAGRLDDALRLARTLPPAADAPAAWRALLGACRAAGGTPGSVKVGEAAFAAAVAADPSHPAAYVLMAEVYAAAGMEAAAAGVHTRRRRAGAWKEPGRSWCADEEGVVHTFVAGGVLGK